MKKNLKSHFDAFWLMPEQECRGITDSLLLDSDREVASAMIGSHDYGIRTQGHVSIAWKGTTYHHRDEFPDDLVEAIRSGAVDSNPEGSIFENNWYELFVWDGEGNLVDSDVIDINLQALTEEDVMAIFLDAEGRYFPENK